MKQNIKMEKSGSTGLMGISGNNNNKKHLQQYDVRAMTELVA